MTRAIPAEDFHSSRSIERHSITTDLNGGDIGLTVHQIQGVLPGPTVAFVATVHGNEWFYIEVVRRFLDSIEHDSLAGTVLAVSVANPVAFGQLSRTTPDASDTPDLNRAFPGGFTSITDQLAQAIDRHLLVRSDYLVQFDCGPWGWAISDVMYGSDYPDPEVTARSRAMALAYGHPLVRTGQLATVHPGPRSLAGYAGIHHRIPSILVEIGGSGFDAHDEEGWIASNVAGCRRLLQYLGMMSGRPEPIEAFISGVRERVNPSVAGMLQPHVGAGDLGSTICEGQLLGVMRDPYTFAEIEELRARHDGRLFYVARPQPLRPGDFAMGIMLDDGSELTTGESAPGGESR